MDRLQVQDLGPYRERHRMANGRSTSRTLWKEKRTPWCNNSAVNMPVKREASWDRIQWTPRSSTFRPTLTINMGTQTTITEWRRSSRPMESQTIWQPKPRIPIKSEARIKWTQFKCSKMLRRCPRRAHQKQEEILQIKKAKCQNLWAKVEASKQFKFWAKSKH